MRTADDDSGPVPYETFTLPRAVLHWETPPRRRLAGHVQRAAFDPDRTPVARRDPWPGSRAQPRASADELDDAPTTAIPVLFLPRPILARPRERPGALPALRARAAQLWRDRPLRTAAVVAGVALVSYLAVLGAQHRSSSDRSQTVLAPAAALPAAAAIVVEQLNEAGEPRDKEAAPLRLEPSSKPGKRRISRRAHETSFAATPASKSSDDQAIAPAQSKSRQAERSSTTVSSSSAGLPAWGAVAVRDFSGEKSSKAASVTQAPTVKPPSSSANVPSLPAPRPSAREQPKPAPAGASKPAEPPEPVAPPRPSKPLTMEQILNQVEEAAQAQRKQAGLKAPKTSQRDAELDELINGAMKSKKE